jgi:hypothetical protein
METNRRRFITSTAAAALALAVMPRSFALPKDDVGYRAVYILRENAWAVSKFDELRCGDWFLLWDMPRGFEDGKSIYVATSGLSPDRIGIKAVTAMVWLNGAWEEPSRAAAKPKRMC